MKVLAWSLDPNGIENKTQLLCSMGPGIGRALFLFDYASPGLWVALRLCPVIASG